MTEELSDCPGCRRKTKTMLGRCTNCAYPKTAAASTFASSYLARGSQGSVSVWSVLATWAPIVLVIVIVAVTLTFAGAGPLALGACIAVLALAAGAYLYCTT